MELKGLELALELTKGNYDQKFLRMGTPIWKIIFEFKGRCEFFCDKTIKETNTKFEETKDILKLELENNEYTEIK